MEGKPMTLTPFHTRMARLDGEAIASNKAKKMGYCSDDLTVV